MKFSCFYKSAVLAFILSFFAVVCYADGTLSSEFAENFDDIKLHISYNGTDQNSIINSGKPVDGDYSDTTVYPDGENSIYEGNAANNLYVYDAKGNKIYGGIDGWVGHYSGASGDYNKSNRRLTVRNDGKFADNNVLSFEPAKGTEGAFSSFGRENIDLGEISIWESDIAIATPGSGAADDYSTFTLSITKNPINSGYEYENSIPLVQFATKDQAANANAEIRILGNKVCDIKVISMYSSTKMYRVKYVLDNSGEVPMHWIVIKDGETVVASSEPAVVENYGEFFTEGSSYGILYRAVNVYEKLGPRYLLDNISFTKSVSANIVNEEAVTSEKYPFENAEIRLQFDSEISAVDDSMVIIRDYLGNIVPVMVVCENDALIIKANSLKPQEHYIAEIKNIPYGDSMFLTKSLKIRSKPNAEVENAVRKDNKVQITLKNNCLEEKNYIVLLTANKNKSNAAAGIYYKKVTIPAGQSVDTDIENITLKEISFNDVKFNVFVIDSLTYMHSMSDKYEF